jgi:iron complex outermembrane recepter protein
MKTYGKKTYAPFSLSTLNLALLACLASSGTSAQESASSEKPKSEDATLDVITVTGSRSSNRSATETAVPIDVISKEMIEATGASETGRLLQKLAPSFNFPQSFVSDGTDLIWPASLRGMGPDQVLVLVNGKRRHQQALVNVQQSIGRGSAGTDINAIPIAAIERIEVLRDGASAQYGSDAIAGVINIILNDQQDGGFVNGEVGQTTKGDGETFRVGANGGFALGEGFLNLTGEYLDRGETNRAGPDTLRVNPPRVTQRIGDADMSNKAIWFNAEVPFGAGDFYAFGGVSKRDANSSGFFRSKGDGRTIPALYPNGFLPTLLTTADDWSAALGLRGDVNDAWKYDFSLNRGSSRFEFGTRNSANVSWFFEPKPGGGIFGETPTSAQDGTLRATQLTANADLKGSIDWGVGTEPLYLGTGLEWRRDGYEIIAGDPVSYTYGRSNRGSVVILNQTGGAAAPGIQGFPGFTPGTEVDKSRRSLALYVDAESKITEKFLLGAAVRFEDYSDTGNNQTGKLTGRFDVTDAFALRGSLSTGVRAPGIQQAYFSQVSTTLGSGGVLTDTVTVRQGSPLAAQFGIKPLKEESSRNATLGFIFRPDNGFSLTLDFYRIAIKDRIVLSGYITPDGPANCVTASVCPARVLLASVNVGAANFFTNAIDTRTTGVDIVAQYDMELSNGAKLVWDFGFGHNQTKVQKIRSSSSLLAPNVVFDDTQVNLVEKGLPRNRGSLGASYRQDAWRFDFNNSYYGSVRGTGFGPVYTSKGKWLTDLSVNYALSENLDFTVGGNNVFNVYPDKWVGGTPFPELGFTYGWETLPFGLNGAAYYGKVNWKF